MKKVTRTSASRRASRIARVGPAWPPQSKVSAISPRARLPRETSRASSPGPAAAAAAGADAGSAAGVALAAGAAWGVASSAGLAASGGAEAAAAITGFASDVAVASAPVEVRAVVEAGGAGPGAEQPASSAAASSPARARSGRVCAVRRALRPLPSVAMTTAFVTDPLYLEHRHDGHPERPERLAAILAQLERSGLRGRMAELAAPEATAEEITRVHSRRALERPAELAAGGGGWVDVDTFV